MAGAIRELLDERGIIEVDDAITSLDDARALAPGKKPLLVNLTRNAKLFGAERRRHRSASPWPGSAPCGPVRADCKHPLTGTTAFAPLVHREGAVNVGYFTPFADPLSPDATWYGLMVRPVGAAPDKIDKAREIALLREEVLGHLGGGRPGTGRRRGDLLRWARPGAIVRCGAALGARHPGAAQALRSRRGGVLRRRHPRRRDRRHRRGRGADPRDRPARGDRQVDGSDPALERHLVVRDHPDPGAGEPGDRHLAADHPHRDGLSALVLARTAGPAGPEGENCDRHSDGGSARGCPGRRRTQGGPRPPARRVPGRPGRRRSCSAAATCASSRTWSCATAFRCPRRCARTSGTAPAPRPRSPRSSAPHTRCGTPAVTSRCGCCRGCGARRSGSCPAATA